MFTFSELPSFDAVRDKWWGLAGRGKRGRARVIYFLRLAPGQILLVKMYGKNVRESIDPAPLRRLKEIFENG